MRAYYLHFKYTTWASLRYVGGLTRYTDSELRYVGGLTRVLAVDRSISFAGSCFSLPALIFNSISLNLFVFVSLFFYFVLFYRVNGEAFRVLWQFCDSEVSVAEWRFGKSPPTKIW